MDRWVGGGICGVSGGLRGFVLPKWWGLGGIVRDVRVIDFC